MRRARSWQSGSAAIEFALVLPALMGFLFALIDTGRLIWTQTTLNHAIEAAARCAIIDTVQCGTAAQVKTYAVAQAYGMTINSSAVTIASQSCGTQIATTLAFKPIVPWFGTGTINLGAKACYPVNVP